MPIEKYFDYVLLIPGFPIIPNVLYDYSTSVNATSIISLPAKLTLTNVDQFNFKIHKSTNNSLN